MHRYAVPLAENIATPSPSTGYVPTPPSFSSRIFLIILLYIEFVIIIINIQVKPAPLVLSNVRRRPISFDIRRLRKSVLASGPTNTVSIQSYDLPKRACTIPQTPLRMLVHSVHLLCTHSTYISSYLKPPECFTFPFPSKNQRCLVCLTDRVCLSITIAQCSISRRALLLCVFVRPRLNEYMCARVYVLPRLNMCGCVYTRVYVYMQ